ncbi:MAG: hypothetical protein WDO73_04215 [Ignavibacteriota bacterium]
MLATHAAELGVVKQQVGQLPTLLHQVNVSEAVDALLESRDADQFTKDQSGVLKTQGLIEVADE